MMTYVPQVSGWLVRISLGPFEKLVLGSGCRGPGVRKMFRGVGKKVPSILLRVMTQVSFPNESSEK